MAHEFEPWPSAARVGMRPPLADVLPAALEMVDTPHPRRRAASG
jgi:hypothetical protein